MKYIPTRRLAALCLAATVLIASAAAHAAPGEQDTTIAKIVDLNREGVALYQKKHFDGARKVLKQALELCESAGLDHHPVAARTHIHLGIVIVAGFGQREIGSRQFSEALQIDPNITLTPGLETPAATEVFNEVLLAVSQKTGPSAPTQASDDTSAAPQGSDNELPTENAVAAARTEESTETRPTTASHEGNDDGDNAAPRAQVRAARRSQDQDGDDATAGSLEGRYQIGALVGGGFGWASGMGDVNADTRAPSSFAGAKLGQLALEAGYWWKANLMLSLQGRLQLVTGPNAVETADHTYEPAKYAGAIFGTATWSPEMGPLRPFVSGSIGAGRIRHVVTLPSLKDCGASKSETCVDTIGAGPFLAGVGGGLTYPLTDNLVLVGALATQIGAPTFTFNVDIDAGLAFRL
jgi:hypothetical protein